jgi:hypothetical protein
MAPGKKRSCIGSLMLWLTALTCPAVADASEPDRNDILVAMKKASSFMRENVALRGGHVWVVSEDLERRWGEVPARPTQIWLQGGTESVGQVMLDAYEATVDESYLDAAREAADAIVYGRGRRAAGIISLTSTLAAFTTGTSRRRRATGSATRNTATTTATLPSMTVSRRVPHDSCSAFTT